MDELISKATNEVFKPTFGARSDVESRIAIRLLLLYLCEKGVIDGGDYRSFVESVSDNASKMIEDENHPIPMSSNNQEEKDKLKDDVRKNLMSFVGHLPVNTKPSGYMLDGIPIEEVIKANSDGSVTFYADTNEKLKAQLYQSAVTFSQLRKCDIKDVFVNDLNIEERKEKGRVTAVIELDACSYSGGSGARELMPHEIRDEFENELNVKISEMISRYQKETGFTIHTLDIELESDEENRRSVIKSIDVLQDIY